MRSPRDQVQIKKRPNLEATQSLRAKRDEDQVKKLGRMAGKSERNLRENDLSWKLCEVYRVFPRTTGDKLM